MTVTLVMSDVTAALGRKYAAGVDELRPENVVKCVSYSLARPESYQSWVDIAALALMMAQRFYVAPAAEPTPPPPPKPNPEPVADERLELAGTTPSRAIAAHYRQSTEDA